MLAAFALRNWKALAAGGLILLAIVVAAVAFERGMAAIERMEARAATTARDERDAHWRAEIAKSNAIVAEARLEQASAALSSEALLRATESKLATELSTMRGLNAALPDGDRCGLGRDRVRLLNRSRR